LNNIKLKRMEVALLAKKLRIEQSKKKNSWNLLRYEDNIIDKDMLTSPHIQIFGNGKINIEGCYGVFEYTDSYLKLKLQKGTLILCGSDFDIVFYEEKLMTVKGKLSSVEFCV